jgi:pimeloyl-ACP methyl ester carboxylesterase
MAEGTTRSGLEDTLIFTLLVDKSVEKTPDSLNYRAAAKLTLILKGKEMKKNILLGLAAGLAALFSLVAMAGAGGADYAREQKWADEVVPGLVVGDPVYLQTPRGHHKFLTLFTPVAGTDKAVIVVHGMGIHPDWGMVGTLRTELADRGFATLSIQMPILAADAKGEAYPPTFPEAAERIGEAVKFLKSKGYTKLGIVSHSMGSRMSRVYVTGKPDPAVKAWASLGLSYDDYAGVKLPVLDLYGDNDLPAVLDNVKKRKGSLKAAGSEQMVIPHTDHFYTGHEAEMVAAVADFLNANLK